MKKTKNKATPQATQLRGFAMGRVGCKTEITIVEYSDGSMGVNLVTNREGMEPLVTGLHLASNTFGLISDAMFVAAHGQAQWTDIIQDA